MYLHTYMISFLANEAVCVHSRCVTYPPRIYVYLWRALECAEYVSTSQPARVELPSNGHIPAHRPSATTSHVLRLRPGDLPDTDTGGVASGKGDRPRRTPASRTYLLADIPGADARSGAPPVTRWTSSTPCVCKKGRRENGTGDDAPPPRSAH